MKKKFCNPLSFFQFFLMLFLSFMHLSSSAVERKVWVSADNGYVYQLNYSDLTSGTTTIETISSIKLSSAGNVITQMAVTANGEWIYACCPDDFAVYLFNTVNPDSYPVQTIAMVAQPTPGTQRPITIAMSSSGKYAWVGCALASSPIVQGGSIQKIDLLTQKAELVYTYGNNSYPQTIVVNPNPGNYSGGYTDLFYVNVYTPITTSAQLDTFGYPYTDTIQPRNTQTVNGFALARGLTITNDQKYLVGTYGYGAGTTSGTFKYAISTSGFPSQDTYGTAYGYIGNITSGAAPYNAPLPGNNVVWFRTYQYLDGTPPSFAIFAIAVAQWELEGPNALYVYDFSGRFLTSYYDSTASPSPTTYLLVPGVDNNSQAKIVIYQQKNTSSSAYLSTPVYKKVYSDPNNTTPLVATLYNVVISAPQTASLTGTVSLSGGGYANGATVSLSPPINTQNTATTDINGNYTISDIISGVPYTASASYANYGTQNTQSFTPGDGQTVTKNFSLLPDPGTLSGTVYNNSGDPISSATITVSNDQSGQFSGQSGNDGSYSIPGIAEGTYELFATADGYNFNYIPTIQIIKNATTHQDIILSATGPGPGPGPAPGPGPSPGPGPNPGPTPNPGLGPINGFGVQKKGNFGLQYELVNKISWSPSVTPIVAYKVYRNGAPIAILGNATLEYEDHDRKKGAEDIYFVTSLGTTGLESPPLIITIK